MESSSPVNNECLKIDASEVVRRLVATPVVMLATEALAIVGAIYHSIVTVVLLLPATVQLISFTDLYHNHVAQVGLCLKIALRISLPPAPKNNPYGQINAVAKTLFFKKTVSCGITLPPQPSPSLPPPIEPISTPVLAKKGVRAQGHRPIKIAVGLLALVGLGVAVYSIYQRAQTRYQQLETQRKIFEDGLPMATAFCTDAGGDPKLIGDSIFHCYGMRHSDAVLADLSPAALENPLISGMMDAQTLLKTPDWCNEGTPIVDYFRHTHFKASTYLGCLPLKNLDSKVFKEAIPKATAFCTDAGGDPKLIGDSIFHCHGMRHSDAVLADLSTAAVKSPLISGMMHAQTVLKNADWCKEGIPCVSYFGSIAYEDDFFSSCRYSTKKMAPRGLGQSLFEKKWTVWTG